MNINLKKKKKTIQKTVFEMRKNQHILLLRVGSMWLCLTQNDKVVENRISGNVLCEIHTKTNISSISHVFTKRMNAICNRIDAHANNTHCIRKSKSISRCKERS